MSRGIRDLREIICVSRLCNVYQNEDILNISDQYLGECVNNNPQFPKPVDKILNKKHVDKSNGKSLYKSPPIKAALPNIKNCSNSENLHEFMKYFEMINEKLLSEWLCKANKQLHELIEWAQDNNAFVNFTNFWLVELPSNQRRELFAMEYEILVEQIKIGLVKYIHNNSLADKLTNQLILISFWEYQLHFISSSGGYYLFLEYFDGLVSIGCESYKSILTNVKFSTQNKHLIKILLTIRALALVSIWTSVINFYRNLIGRGDVQLKSIEIHLPDQSDVMYSRICMAICHQFIPTLQYWINKKKINLQEFRDEQSRNLLILAVSYNSLSVVQYFVNNYDVSTIINCVSNSGNSALHLAVCQGNIDAVKLLIENGHADVNIPNTDCDDCTPLHMAAMYGQQDIAQCLVEHGANPSMVTGSNSTAIDMANLYEQHEIAKLLHDANHVQQLPSESISSLHRSDQVIVDK